MTDAPETPAPPAAPAPAAANGLPPLGPGGRPNLPPPPRVPPQAPPRPRPQPTGGAEEPPGPGFTTFTPQTAELFEEQAAPAAKDCAIGAKAGGALLVVVGAGLLYVGLDLLTGGAVSRGLAGARQLQLDEE